MTRKLQKSVEARVGDVEARMENIEVRMEAMEVRMGKLEVRMDHLEVRMEALEIGFQSFASRWEEEQRKTGVLLEHLEYKFDLMIEGFGILNKKTFDYEERIKTLEQMLS